ncbi:MAG: 4Fe-4S dicluster domain-containing protein [Coriobacteriales bacterium]|jgi:succinate dehydrogenase/fumarate reductase iron-sulfur protein|nr:4Fe-4S dicluster domain-containing protein [Coriobacteriales bacterium]
MPESYSITIKRFDAQVDTRPYHAVYEVPDDPEFAPMTALKALHWINYHVEPVAYDYNCRRGTCGRCAIMVDDEPRLACLHALTGTHHFAPLTGFPVVRDLVVNKHKAYARFVMSSHSIKTLTPDGVLQPLSGQFWRDKIYPLNACRECMCCYASCHALNVFNKWGRFAGPGALQEIYLRHIDGQDRSDRIEQAVFSGLFECVQCGNCTTNCPALIASSENIKEMMDEAERRGLMPQGEATSYWPVL